jgi:hypothetical protein
MTVDIKYSWFEAQKGFKRSKRILNNSERFGIVIPEDIKRQIWDKRGFYYKQINKLSTFAWEFKSTGDVEKALEKIRKIHYPTESLSLVQKLRKMF